MSEANEQAESGSVCNPLLCRDGNHDFGDVFNCIKCGIAIENLPLLAVSYKWVGKEIAQHWPRGSVVLIRRKSRSSTGDNFWIDEEFWAQWMDDNWEVRGVEYMLIESA